MKQKLTVRVVEGLEPGLKDIICMDTEVPGFGLKITPKGRRSFFLYYRTADHTQRRPAIGTYPAIRPEQARAIAQGWLADVRQGRDPSAERQVRRKMRGQGRIIDLFEDYQRDRSHLRSIDEIVRVFERDILPTIGKLKAEEVTRADVTRLLDKLANRSQVVASNARKRLSAFYTWALPRLPHGTVNPVIGAAVPALPAARERVLSDVELVALWHVLDAESEPWSTALRLLLLTGQRRSEVFEADWSELDLDRAIWTIPSARTKNGKVQILPLSEACLNLLRSFKPSGPIGLAQSATRRFAKLTQQTRLDVERAHWSDLDLGNGVWQIPKTRSTHGREATVRLAPEAVEFLYRHLRTGPLFPGSAQRGYSRAARRIRGKLDASIGSATAPWSWHDLRRTVATGLQRLGVRLEVTEAVLNHVGGTRSGIVGVYQRYDWQEEKRQALNLWAEHVSTLNSKESVSAHGSH